MSTTLERVKLENPGDEFTMTIAEASTEDRGGFDYAVFSDGQNEVSIPTKSVMAQLDRVGVANIHNLAGKTVRFSRSEKVNKYGKPYWNLDLVAAKTTKPAYVQPQIASKPNSQLPPLLQNAEEEDAAELAAKIGFDVGSIKKELALYQAISEFIVRDIAPIYEAGKIGMSPESAAACAQTLFINITGGKK